MKKSLLLLAIILLTFTSCTVEFSPNAPWRDVPSVYSVIDPDEDTVWVRVQRCYLGEDNLYNYSSIADSNYYLPGQISVHLLAWKGVRGEHNSIVGTNQLVDRWELTYTERPGKPEGNFPSGLQPLFYCVPGPRFIADTDCLFQLVILRNPAADTLATATTTLVGHREPTIHLRDTVEEILVNPSLLHGHDFRFVKGASSLEWNPVPRGRRYQPFITFYYRRMQDTCSLTIPGGVYRASGNMDKIGPFNAISEDRFLSLIKTHLQDNKDSLFTVNNVDITISVCNEDLNAYINSLDRTVMGGQETSTYSNIDGGVGIFASRRSHITVNVPADSFGNPNNLPQRLVDLGVGFYGHF